MKRRRALGAGVASLATALAGCLDVAFGPSETETFSDSYDVTDETVVTLSNRNGDLTVTEAVNDRLVVSGKKFASSQKGLDGVRVDVTEGSRFDVEVVFESGAELSNRGVDLTVEVPHGVTIRRASTGNGTISAAGVRGDLIARTSNGDVEIEDVDGYVGAETTNGDVEITETTGLAGARTTNGSVDAELYDLAADVTCRSSNGSVTVRVGPDLATEIRLETNNGDATVSDLEYTATTDRPALMVGRLRGGGDSQLTLQSSNGDVTLRPV